MNAPQYRGPHNPFKVAAEIYAQEQAIDLARREELQRQIIAAEIELIGTEDRQAPGVERYTRRNAEDIHD